MSNYKMYKNYQKKYPAWSIQEVQHFFENELGALSIPLDHPDPDVQNHFNDPFIPPREKICGVYCIYKKSILALLQGEVENKNGLNFSLKQKKDATVGLNNADSILSFGPLVILETNDHKYISGCFIGGEADRLYNLITFFAGLPPISEMKFYPENFRGYLAAVKDVKRMGFFNIDIQK